MPFSFSTESTSIHAGTPHRSASDPISAVPRLRVLTRGQIRTWMCFGYTNSLVLQAGTEMPHVHGEWNAVTRDKVERGIWGGGRFPKCTKSQLCKKNTFWRFNGHDDYSSSVLDTSILLP